MKLVIFWTLVGAFVFTVVITLLSLIGIVKFADASQQRKLFYVIVVELASGSVGIFLGVLQPSTGVVKEKVQQPIQEQKAAVEAAKDTLAKTLDENKTQLAETDAKKAELEKANQELMSQKQELVAKVETVQKEMQSLAAAPAPAPSGVPVEQYQALQEKNQELQKAVDEYKTVAESLTERLKAASSRKAAH